MILTALDTSIIIAYLLVTIAIGLWISRKASRSLKNYFLGGNKLPWYMLGLSNASGMFDISGSMLLVSWLFIYGLKSIFIPWLWPVFNQIFSMIYLSIWLRRSGVMTGAEWIKFRFGNSRGAELSHLVVVAFALLNVIGFLAYGFIGIGKFAAVFLPWQLSADAHINEIFYGLIITAITTFYVVKGGMFSVVFTEVLQFVVMTIACIAVGVIAMIKVSPDTLRAVVPDGWMSPSFGWSLELDWSATLESANERIISDGWSLFSIFLMLVLFKGILQSLAGPAPNYDMQRVLSARSPKEAAKMSGFVNIVLIFPRYMLVTGLTILALAFFMGELGAMGNAVDFEKILPFVLKNFIPSGLLGLLIAGLLAAFMSTFAATTNAAPAYVVNDIYRRYFKPDADQRTLVRLSYIVSILFVLIGTTIGLFIPSLNELVLWIVGALYGGYTASNMLKWYWWRFNGFGYFYGMVAGIVTAIPLFFIAISPIYAFPILFSVCLAAAVLGSLMTAPDDMDVLKNFYIKTRPWGVWGPVEKACIGDRPELQSNREFGRDIMNVVVGVCWQTSLTAAPIFMVTRSWPGFCGAMVIVAVTSIHLKFAWFDRLKDYPDDISDADSGNIGSKTLGKTS